MLSLLLLVSQQMAFAHAMTHLNGQIDAVQSGQARQLEGNDLSGSLAQDQSCAQCLAFAQIGAAIHGSTPAFTPPAIANDAVVSRHGSQAAARTVCAFHSRAPPYSH